jgi:hypothetical protein
MQKPMSAIPGKHREREKETYHKDEEVKVGKNFPAKDSRCVAAGNEPEEKQGGNIRYGQESREAVAGVMVWYMRRGLSARIAD